MIGDCRLLISTEMAVLLPSIRLFADVLNGNRENVSSLERSGLGATSAEKFRFGVNVILTQGFAIGAEPRSRDRFPGFPVMGVVGSF